LNEVECYIVNNRISMDHLPAYLLHTFLH